MFDLTKLSERKRLIGQIESEPNKARKQWSLRQYEIQSGRIEQYVKESLQGQYNLDSVREMPIVSSINVQKRLVDKKSVVYKSPATRTFSDLKDDSVDVLNEIYTDMKADVKLNQSNKGFVYQDQSIGMIVPKNGKLVMRVFKMHQIDAIIDDADPEDAQGFVISSFDRSNYIQLAQDKKDRDTATGVTGRSVRSSASESDGDELDIGNEFQYRKYVQRFIVWDEHYNFIMNGNGGVLDSKTGEFNENATDKDIKSPLAEMGIKPFFEVSKDKDFEFFVRPSNSLTDFTIQFNVSLSDLQNNMKMNGYSVAVLKCPSDLQPQNQVIGPAMLIKLPTDDPDKEVDFSFASPNSSIGEIGDAIEKQLNYFITTEGIGGDAINSNGATEKFTSGLDRFIAMVGQTDASRDDYEAYRDTEKQIYEIIKAWLTVLKGDDSFDKKYQVDIPVDSKITVEFHKPEMVQTEDDKLNAIERKIDLGLMSRLDAIMELKSITDKDDAKKLLEEIDEIETNDDDDMGLIDGKITKGQTQSKPIRDEARNRPKTLPEKDTNKK